MRYWGNGSSSNSSWSWSHAKRCRSLGPWPALGQSAAGMAVGHRQELFGELHWRLSTARCESGGALWATLIKTFGTGINRAAPRWRGQARCAAGQEAEMGAISGRVCPRRRRNGLSGRCTYAKHNVKTHCCSRTNQVDDHCRRCEKATPLPARSPPAAHDQTAWGSGARAWGPRCRFAFPT
ncbi:hypothetical protein VTI74DRAFT_6608 [Chaetomium olivicolor]